MPYPRAVLRKPWLRISVAALLFAATACIQVAKIMVREVPHSAAPTLVATPLKAHLVDGSTVVFLHGATVAREGIRGDGTRHTIANATSAVSFVPIDSVVGLETFRRQVQVAGTVLLSAVATIGVAVVVAELAVALFGSCPTFYSDSAGVPVLEAEGFSYSIAPLFEVRDVDRLRAGPGADGRLRLEVRNEALETHYLNHIELLEVRHATGEVVTPDGAGMPLALRGLRPVARAYDRAGRDVAGVLAATDGAVFETDPRTLDKARLGDTDDFIDVMVPVAATADSVALMFRMRNSLLNTVLLYDGMLSAGGRSLSWMATDLHSISNAVELGRWYNTHLGLRIALTAGGDTSTVARVDDSGPIAFHDVTVVIPAPREARRGDYLPVRLSFTADEWRIDRLAVAASYRRPAMRTIPVTRLTRDDGTADAKALASVREPDEDYLVTNPGQLFHIAFDVGTITPDSARTFMLASQGYYTEWVRGSWIKSATTEQSFQPSDSALFAALQRWKAKRAPFEKQFFASRLPVR